MARGTATTTVTAERSIIHRLFWPEDQTEYDAGFTRQQDFERAIEAITRRTDNVKTPFKWRVFWVAALGFLTDSYNLFASNVVLPALSYIYWNTKDKNNEVGFNIATLVGSICGQLIFGVAVDIYGRRSLYGFELMIVVVSTIGLLQCSEGYFDPASGHSTWGITPWLFFWRVIQGVGIGAEYPLSACIAAEWSSRHSRARMMSAVFLMQPLGQLLAYIVGMIAIGKLGNDPDNMLVNIDIFWRVVIGVGAAPTILALFARRLIPESWRFTYFVIKNPWKADCENLDVYRRSPTIGPREGANDSPGHDSVIDDGSAPMSLPASRSLSAPVWRPGAQFAWKEFSGFLYAYRFSLLGTSLCWFLLDVAFYGLGFNSPGTLAKLWSPNNITFADNAPWWQTNTDVISPNTTAVVAINGVNTTQIVANPQINDVLFNTMKHALYTTSIAAIVGSAVFIGTAHLLNRRKMLIGTFFALSVLLAITAGVFRPLFHDGALTGNIVPGQHIVLVFLWALIQFFFNFGPNTLTFIIPAEVFPTRYRCTAYAIAAASGKLGAVVVQIANYKTTTDTINDPTTLQWMLAAFAVCMALGGVVALFPAAIPDVQNGMENKSLEELCDDQYFTSAQTKREA